MVSTVVVMSGTVARPRRAGQRRDEQGGGERQFRRNAGPEQDAAVAAGPGDQMSSNPGSGPNTGSASRERASPCCRAGAVIAAFVMAPPPRVYGWEPAAAGLP